MREHGYLDQFPISESAGGVVVDGRARLAAAFEADVTLRKEHRISILPRRDTPLYHVRLVLDANWARMSDGDRRRVHDAVALPDRSWISIEEDLALTREWRRAVPHRYVAQLKVKKMPYRPSEEPKVQITMDDSRVMLRSLLEAAGVPVYDYVFLSPYVVLERARTQFSGGSRAIFVGTDDAIEAIGTMQRERVDRKLKVDKEWDDIREWLIKKFGKNSRPDDGVPQRAAPQEDAEAVALPLT